jgi:hypothetical protein
MDPAASAAVRSRRSERINVPYQPERPEPELEPPQDEPPEPDEPPPYEEPLEDERRRSSYSCWRRRRSRSSASRRRRSSAMAAATWASACEMADAAARRALSAWLMAPW